MTGGRISASTLADFISAAEVKAVQHDFRQKDPNYGASSHGKTSITAADLSKAISGVREGDLRRALGSVPVDCDKVEDFWAHGMALFAGRHFFPDANHRTGTEVVARAATVRCRLECALPDDAGKALVNASKDMRRHHGPYSVDELADASNSYRRLFRERMTALKCQPVPK